MYSHLLDILSYCRQLESGQTIENDVRVTLCARDQSRFSQCPDSPVVLTFVCLRKSVLDRKRNEKLHLVFCPVHISFDDRLDEFDESLWLSKENSKIPPPIRNCCHTCPISPCHR